MKRLAAFLLALFLLVSAAYADPLTIRAELTDNVIFESGSCDFLFSIYNGGSEKIEEIIIYSASGKKLAKAGPVGAGERLEVPLSAEVTDADLKARKKIFTISHEYETGVVNYTVEIRTVREKPNPSIEFLRLLPQNGYRKGDTCEIRYRVENTGNVPFRNICVDDEANSYHAETELLAPGASLIFSNRFTIENDTVSHATFSAENVRDGETSTAEASESTVTAGTAELKVTIMSNGTSLTAGESVLLGAVVENTGTLDLSDLEFTGAYQGLLTGCPNMLAAGESIELEREVKPRENATFALTVTGRTPRGQKITAMSTPLAVTCVPDESIRELSLEAVPRAEALNSKGSMPVSVKVWSTSGAEIRDVDIADDTLGVLRHVDILSGTVPAEMTISVPVEKKTEFVLRARAEGAEESAAASFTVSISKNGIAPEGMPDGYERRDSFGLPFTWTLFAAFGALAVLVVLLVRSVRREKREKMRKREEKRIGFSKTGKYKPVKRDKKK